MGDSGVISSSIGMVKSTIHHTASHSMKIDVTKFDEKDNFSMWRCEVMGALCSLNLDDILAGDEYPDGMTEKA